MKGSLLGAGAIFQPGRSDEPRLEVSEAVTSLECLGNLGLLCTCSSQDATCQLCGWRFEVHREEEDRVGNPRVKTERDLGRGRPQVDTRLSPVGQEKLALEGAKLPGCPPPHSPGHGVWAQGGTRGADHS